MYDMYYVLNWENMKHVCFKLTPQPVSMVLLFSTLYYILSELFFCEFSSSMIQGRFHLSFLRNQHFFQFQLFCSNLYCLFVSLVWWVPHWTWQLKLQTLPTTKITKAMAPLEVELIPQFKRSFLHLLSCLSILFLLCTNFFSLFSWLQLKVVVVGVLFLP